MSILLRLSVLSARQVIHTLVAVCSLTSTQEKLSSAGEEINQLQQILTYIRQFNNLHPHYARQQYGDLEGYLRQHLSQDEWCLFYETSHRQLLNSPALTSRGNFD